MLWLEVILVEEKLKWSHAPVWAYIHPCQIGVCCFLSLAFLPQTALALKGNYFSFLESYKISSATSQRGIQAPYQHCAYGII